MMQLKLEQQTVSNYLEAPLEDRIPPKGMSNHPFLDPPSLRGADSLPVRNASLDVLDLDKVAAHIDKASRSGRYAGTDEPRDYLLNKECAVLVEDEIYATLAGILCFGRNPQKLFPNAVVDIGHYRGSDAVSFEVVHLEKNIGGTIFDQLGRVEEYLWRNTFHGMALAQRGLERVEVHEYPLAVIRELVVNMLAHRDYTLIGSSARVMKFRDRIEWVNPGGLPPGVAVEDILDIQNARNPVLLRIMYEAGFMEAFGQGLNTVVTVLQREGMQPPVFRDVGAAFIVVVRGRLVEGMETGPFVSLNETQRSIVSVLRSNGEATFTDLREALPGRAERTLQQDVQGLVEADIVERVGKTRSVRYRLRGDASG